MKAVVQRVSEASVTVDTKIVGAIQKGFLILLGVGEKDTEEDISYLVNKITQLRVFTDENGKMNKDIKEVDGNCLVVSQFTLYADTKKGNRPSFLQAAKPEKATEYYEIFCALLQKKIEKSIAKGIFGADMKVALLNDGPVTILYDSKNK